MNKINQRYCSISFNQPRNFKLIFMEYGSYEICPLSGSSYNLGLRIKYIQISSEFIEHGFLESCEFCKQNFDDEFGF